MHESCPGHIYIFGNATPRQEPPHSLGKIGVQWGQQAGAPRPRAWANRHASTATGSELETTLLGVCQSHRDQQALQIRTPSPQRPSLNISERAAPPHTKTRLRWVPEPLLGEPPTSWGCKFT